MFEKVLVCLDGSKLAEQILPYATEQALRFNSKLTLLQVMTLPSSAHVSAEGISAGIGDIIDEEVREQEAELRAYLDSVAQSPLNKGIDTECVVLRPSHPGEAIVKYAQAHTIDIICIATHGHGGLGRVVFGSVADHVLRKSGLPILVIKPEGIEQ
jgi:nucleotide-binding universal stress UspA family protein